jgi:hypothetical protein
MAGTKPQREGQLSAALARIMRSQNAIVIPQVATKYGMLGVADKYICHRYWRGWMEFKVAPEVLRQDQTDFAKLVIERGDNYALVTFLDRQPLKENTQLQVTQFWPDFTPYYHNIQASDLLRALASIVG